MEGKGKQDRSFWGGQTRGGRVASTPIGARPGGSSAGAPAPTWKCRKVEKKAKNEEKEEEDLDEEPEEDCDEDPRGARGGGALGERCPYPRDRRRL